MTSDVEFQVVGMAHRLTGETIKRLAADTPLHCKLVREPDNDYDENAIKVMISEKPWAKSGLDMHIGYLPRQVAAVIADSIDNGTWKFTDCWLTDVYTDTGTGWLLLRKPSKNKPSKKLA